MYSLFSLRIPWRNIIFFGNSNEVDHFSEAEWANWHKITLRNDNLGMSDTHSWPSSVCDQVKNIFFVKREPLKCWVWSSVVSGTNICPKLAFFFLFWPNMREEKIAMTSVKCTFISLAFTHAFWAIIGLFVRKNGY